MISGWKPDPEPGDPPLLHVTVPPAGSLDRLARQITVAGEVDAESADTVQEAVLDVLRGHRPQRIEMDLRAVTFLDSAGIRMLLQCSADARVSGSDFAVTAAHPAAYRVLQVSGLLDHLGLTGRPASAGGAADAERAAEG